MRNLNKSLNSGIISLSFIVATFLHAQPTIEWQKSYGGSYSYNFANSIHQTSEGGYIVAGSSDANDGDVSGNHGSYDGWIVKLTSGGNLEWQKSLGGSGSDDANSILQTSDGGYIVAGTSGSNDGDVTGYHGGGDCWIVKLTSAGNIEWQKSLGGNSNDVPHSIQQTSDGGYIVAGSSNSNDGDVTGNHGGSDCWIVKLTSGGTIEWQKSLGGSGVDVANSIQQTSDGGYIVADYSISNDGDVTGNHGGSDYWIVKLTSGGNIEWQKSLGGSGYDWANSIHQTSEGGYIVAGFSRSRDGDVIGSHNTTNYTDYWIVKLTSVGNIEWQKSLGGSNDDQANSIQQTSDGEYIVAGIARSRDGDVTNNNYGNDFSWIVKLTSDGNVKWQKSVEGDYEHLNNSIQQTNDGGYIVASDIIAGGSHTGRCRYLIVKLTSGTSSVDESSSVFNNFSLEQNHPNPFSVSTTIGIKGKGLFEVRDMLGRIVFKKQIDKSNREIHFNGSGLSNGLYQYSLSDGVNVQSRMMMVVR